MFWHRKPLGEIFGANLQRQKYAARQSRSENIRYWREYSVRTKSFLRRERQGQHMLTTIPLAANDFSDVTRFRRETTRNPLGQTMIQRAQSQENAFATTARVAQQAKTDQQPSWKDMADEGTVNFVDAFP
jgi:hypothetical protein